MASNGASNGKALVIDGDGHVMEPPTLWQERMDRKKWGDLVPHFVSEEEGVFIGNTCRARRAHGDEEDRRRPRDDG